MKIRQEKKLAIMFSNMERVLEKCIYSYTLSDKYSTNIIINRTIEIASKKIHRGFISQYYPNSMGYRPAIYFNNFIQNRICTILEKR